MSAKFSATLEDSRGRTTKRVYGMETQALLADYLTAITGFVTALTAVTDLGLVKATLLIDVLGEEFAFVADSNIDVGATASAWLDTTPARKGTVKVPGIKMTLISSDGSMPITGAVATFLAMFETADDFNIAQGQQVDSWIKGALDK